MSAPAPTPQEREARIAELRARRRARMRWLALRGALGVGLLATAAALLLVWLLTTVAGRDALLAQIVARLPAGASLTWRAAEGPASGPLTLRGVRFAHGGTEFVAEEVMLDPALRPLLGRTLRLDALRVRNARLTLPESEEPFELPRWPESLPAIEPPLSLQADDVRIDGLRVYRLARPLIAIRRLRGGLDARRGRLHVEHLRIDSDRGRFALHGDYVPADDYRMDFVATAVLPAAPPRTPPRLGVIARGDAARLDVGLGGALPGPLRATLTLRPGRAPDAPRWSLEARADAFDPALFDPTAEPAPTPWRARVSAQGEGGRARVQGEAAQGELAFVLHPSQLALERQRLDVAPLRLGVLGGEAALRGWADFRDPARRRFRFAVNARGLRWQGREQPVAVVADADFGFAGTLERWAAIGNARLQRGRDRASVRFDGRGDSARVALRSLRADTRGGTLVGHGELAWSPRLAWAFDAALAGFDPGYFAPDWPGALAGRVSTRGERFDDGRLRVDADVPELRGRLRGRALEARGRLAMRPAKGAGHDYEGELALRLGASRVDARGRYARTLDVDARFSPLRLADLLPQAGGEVRGTLRLQGARDAPDVRAELGGSSLAWNAWRAERVQARGHLPWRGDGGALRVDAAGVRAGLPFASLMLDARGAVENLRLSAEAQGEAGALALEGALRRDRARWRGTLGALRLAPPKGARWRLEAPAAFAWRGAEVSLARACLASSAGGRVCAQADWPRRGVDVEGAGLPLALVEPWLPEREDAGAWHLRGEAAFEARLVPVRGGWRGEARLRSSDGGVRLGERAQRELLAYRELRLDVDATPQRVQATLAAALDDGRIDARLATGWDAYAPLSGEVSARTDAITWIELFSPDIVDPQGRLDARLQLAGTPAQPRLGGFARLSAFTAELPALGLVLREGEVRLDAAPDGNARIAGRVRSGEGVLRVDGTLGGQGEAPLQLELRGENVLIADTRQVRAVATPDVQVRYRPGEPLEVRGRVGVPSARLDLERLDDGVATSPDVVVLDPVKPRARAGAGLDLDLVLALGEDVRMDGFGLEGEVTGELRVRQRPGREIVGHGRLEVDGRYTAYGQKLDITRGVLVWSGGPVADPLLDIRAEREVGEVTAGIRVTGRASAPQAEVWSDPASSQSEALAYLALGRPLASLTGEEGRQLDAASAALTAGGSLLASQIGARIGLDDAGVMQSRALGGQVFGVGKYLSPKLYVGYGVSLLGTGQVLTLKYLLRRGFEIEIESSTVENRASINWRKER